MLVLFGDQIKKSSMRDLADVRYILWMMSFFAIFCGVCYNDFVSIPFDAGSCYTRTGPIAIRKNPDCVYAIGFDPIWVLSTNELTFSNSLKMKTSVIFGVVQMSLGIFMKAFNALYFRRYIDFIFEFLPQIVLLWALFGWMDLLIIVKWLTPWQVPCQQTGSRYDSSQAPSIITIMIAMFLKGGAIEPTSTWVVGSDTSGGQPQTTASIALVLIFLICIPIMLLVKPLYLKFTMKPHEDHEEHHDEHHAVNTSDGEHADSKTGMVKKSENIDLDRIL